MPRKRKEISDEAEPSTKQSLRSLNIDGYTVHWQWENDDDWTSYSSDAASLLTESYKAGKSNVIFEPTPKAPIKVLFDQMVQKNRKTGWERRIRCAVKNDSNSDFHVWEWEDEYSKWNPYNVMATIALETASCNNKKSLTLDMGSKQYMIDLKAMKQVNKDTEVERNIKKLNISVDNKELQYSVVKSEPSSSAAADKAAYKSDEKMTSKRSSRSLSSGSRNTLVKEEDKKKSSVRTVIVKGAAPVDPECTAKVNTAHVYSKGKDVYDAMLNQTNLANNNNKYYLLQLLEDDNKKSYSVWFRWGRVGYKGQTKLIPCGPDLEEAIEIFTKKFSDKTKNDWSMRNKFKKVPGKYDIVKMDYKAETALEKKAQIPKEIPPSKLDTKIQSLIDLICDVKNMEAAVIEMKYDAVKAPLGKLTDKQIKAGYSALKKIDNCITNNVLGQKLIEACNEFYTRIPHNFGMQRPPVIYTKAEVHLKLQLLEALADIEIAMNLIKESKIDENPIDTHYNALKCQMFPLVQSTADYQMIEDYLQNTHAPTHNQYKMKIVEVFEVKKDGDDETFVDKGNRTLLWHGSRLTNWVGILSQGLRIAPPEAPVTGYMFGKGIYFADMSSKSANYCYPTQARNEGLLLLCEVSLGKCNELLAADYNAAELPPGTHSVMGKGKLAPDPSKTFIMSNGCTVPLGKPIDTGVTNPKGYTLNYNEFVVYDRKQVKMKYLVRVEFDFN